MTILCGIDYSYTSPAICVYNTDDELKFENLRFYNFYVPKRKSGFLNGIYGNITITAGGQWSSQEDRFFSICLWAQSVLILEKVESVGLEGYAMGSKGGMVFDIAENTALLKNFLYHKDIPFYKQAPTAVKKDFTGKGNAKKEEMIAEFNKRLGVNLKDILGLKKEDEKPVDDLVDAFANLMSHPYFKDTTV